MQDFLNWSKIKNDQKTMNGTIVYKESYIYIWIEEQLNDD